MRISDWSSDVCSSDLGAKADVDDADLLGNEALARGFADVIEHQIEHRAERLRHDAHAFDVERLFLPLAIGLDDGPRMTMLQQGCQRFAMPAKDADRQTSSQPDHPPRDGDWAPRRARQRRGVVREDPT